VREENDKWEKRLNRLFKNYNQKEFNLFIAHDAPYGYFDLVKYKKSPLYGKHVGDKYGLKFIKKHNPNLFICGHMHEYQGKKKLGNTLVVTTGAAFEGKAVVIDFDEEKKKVKKISFLK